MNEMNFPLYLYEHDAYYDNLNHCYWVTITPFELSTEQFIKLSKVIAEAALNGQIPMEDGEWELKYIGQYGSVLQIKFVFDDFGFLETELFSSSDKLIIHNTFKPDSKEAALFHSVIELYKNSQAILENAA